MKSPLEGRVRFVLLLLGAAAGLAAPEARAGTQAPPPLSAVHIIKARHEGLHFRWQAVVGETGGSFVLVRRGERGSHAVRTASPRQREYDVAWAAPAASGAYELRYRGTDGRETLLATLLVNCHTYETGECRSGGALQSGPPLIAPALPAPAPIVVSVDLPEPASICRSLLRAPPVPPPKARALHA